MKCEKCKSDNIEVYEKKVVYKKKEYHTPDFNFCNVPENEEEYTKYGLTECESTFTAYWVEYKCSDCKHTFLDKEGKKIKEKIDKNLKNFEIIEKVTVLEKV